MSILFIVFLVSLGTLHHKLGRYIIIDNALVYGVDMAILNEALVDNGYTPIEVTTSDASVIGK